MKRILTFAGIAIGACIVLVIIGAILSPSTDEPGAPDVSEKARETLSEPSNTLPAPTEILPTAPPTNTPLPTATRSPTQRLKTALTAELGSGNRGIARLQRAEIDGGTIIVTWAIDDNLTENMIRTSAQIDLADILQVIDESGIDYDDILTAGTFSMIDAYGNTEEEIVVSMGYTRQTIDKIQWANFLFDNVYLIADDILFIHPAFMPE